MVNNNEEFYDYFYARDSDSPLKSAEAKWHYYLLQKILKYTDENALKNVLDVGCGQGHKLFFMSKHFNKDVNFFGIDLSEVGISFASEYYKEVSNIQFLKEDVSNLSLLKNFEGEKFKIISLLELLEHVEDWRIFLNTSCQLSSKYILLSFPTGRMREYEKNIGHYRNFKRGEVESFLEERGFRKVKTLYSGFPLYTPIIRNYIDKNYSNLMQSIEHKFTKKQEIFHYFVYLGLRFFSFDNVYDNYC